MHMFFIFLIAMVGLSPAFAQDLTRQRPTRQRHVPAPKPQAQNTSQTNASNKIDELTFQFGTHTEFFNNVQTDTSGTQRKFAFAPTVGMGMKFSLSPDWKFLPEVNWVLPFDTDSGLIKNLFMIRGDFGYEVLDWLRLRVGTSLMFLNMHGKGGKTEINNGAGQSTFYNPDENRTALNNTFDLGAEAFMSKEWSARLQTYTYSLFRSESRQVSYTLFLSYHWE